MKETGIEWTDSTWNPIRGCSRVSAGCRNCYAERVAYRFSGPGGAYEGLVTIGADGQRKRQWNGQVKFVEEHLLDPLKWRAPRRIFVNSMSDLFHENVKDEWIDKIFAVMALCPQHTFQILTKRPERMLAWARAAFTEDGGMRIGAAAASLFHGLSLFDHNLSIAEQCGVSNKFEWHELINVWLGVSCEDQKTADQRIPLLLQAPAAKRFISAEPLLGPIDLVSWLPYERNRGWAGVMKPKLDWVICGGESGPGARPMRAEWAISLRDQCVAPGVPFFFKQWGEWLGEMQDGPVDKDGGVYLNASDEPARIGKKRAGALLDRREWREFPDVA